MAKEKSIIEMQEEQKTLRQASRELLGKAKAEKRALTAEEQATLDENEIRQRELKLEIEERRDDLHSQRNIEGKKESRSFSLVRAIRNTVTGKAQEPTEAEILARAAERQGNLNAEGMLVPFQTRAAMSTTNGVSFGIIDQDNQEMVLPLEQNLVLAQAGARFLTGLRGDLAFPGLSSVTVNWEGESDEAADGTPTPSSALKLSPKRISAIVTLNKQLIMQENQDIEGYVRYLIAVAVANKLESTALGKAAAGEGPAGLFNTAPTLLGAMSWAKIVDMETAVSEAGGLKGNLSYILHSKLYGNAKTLAKNNTGAGGLIVDGTGAMLNGYKCLSTGNVAKEMNVAPSGTADNTGYGAIFGNFADMIVANWGNLDITVDDKTLAGKAQIRLIVHSWWNYGQTHAGSFKTAALKLA